MAQKGFTLVETLVVIAVICVLASLASVSLRVGKEYSKSTACAANLRQIALASLVYARDYKTLPYGFNDSGHGTPPEGFAGTASYDWSGWWWFHFLYDSLGRNLSPNGPLWCPSRLVLGDVADNILCANYGANLSLFRIYDPFPREDYQGTPIRPESPPQPGRMILAMDAGYAWVSRGAAGDHSAASFPNGQRLGSFYIPGLRANEQYAINPNQINDAVNGRHHNKTVNIVFLDGHVGREPANNLLDISESKEETIQSSGYCTLSWSP